MKLLVDLGNSLLKWGTAENGQVQRQQTINYKQIDFAQTIEQSWKKLSLPDLFAVASVGDRQIVEHLITCAQRLWPNIAILQSRSSAQSCGVINAYPQPERLGIDRWLGLLAARRLYAGNCSIVDCGTAITVDFLNNQGRHLGGYIAPGQFLMKQALQRGTADLPFCNRYFQREPADNTETAIHSGTLLAAVGFIEQAIRFQDFNNHLLILTGGDAANVAPLLSITPQIEPDLVLQGLDLYCNEVRK